MLYNKISQTKRAFVWVVLCLFGYECERDPRRTLPTMTCDILKATSMENSLLCRNLICIDLAKLFKIIVLKTKQYSFKTRLTSK